MTPATVGRSGRFYGQTDYVPGGHTMTAFQDRLTAINATDNARDWNFDDAPTLRLFGFAFRQGWDAAMAEQRSEHNG